MDELSQALKLMSELGKRIEQLEQWLEAQQHMQIADSKMFSKRIEQLEANEKSLRAQIADLQRNAATRNYHGGPG